MCLVLSDHHAKDDSPNRYKNTLFGEGMNISFDTLRLSVQLKVLHTKLEGLSI